MGEGIIVELVAAALTLVVLTIVGSISYALRIRGKMAAQTAQVAQVQKDSDRALSEISRVEDDAKDGRAKLHARIDAAESETQGLLREIGDRLDRITEMITEISRTHVALETRLNTIDQRGTKYHQELRDSDD